MLSKTIKYLSTSINIYQGGFCLFHLLPFGVVSSTFQPVVACLWLVPRRSTFYKRRRRRMQVYFKFMQILLRSGPSLITNQANSDILSGATFLYYKVGQVVLQSSAGFKNWAMFITKCSSYYEVGQLLQSRAKQKANERNEGCQQILATDSQTHKSL